MTYTCPMHPEVVLETPGNCPKCGMKLVVKSQVTQQALQSYTPLIVIVVVIFIAAVIVGHSLLTFLYACMTGFFLTFGTFKLFDLQGFVEGYSSYDLLASRLRGYGYLYPFLELGFGFTMLYGYQPFWLLVFEFVVMLFSGIGVLIKILKRERFVCACLGTFLKVPLTYVTLLEDFGMALIILLILLLQ